MSAAPSPRHSSAPDRPAGPEHPCVALGIDVGGTKVAAGLVDPQGTVLLRRSAPTVADSLAVLDQVLTLAASLLDSAKKPDVAQLKKELAATQRDVEAELVSLKDADLAHLISMGGWIRALEVSTVAVDKQFSEERARKVMREDIADYYTESIAGLEPRISERPNYLAMRDLLAGLRSEMTLQDGQAPTPEMMREIREKAAQLVGLALQRKQ